MATNPPTLATDIVVSEAATNPSEEPDNTVEFATYNWPPTAFTDSFSNTAVESVPLILAFSTSRKPPDAAVNLNPLPLTSLAKPSDSIVPSLLIIIEPPVIRSLPNVQPPTVPDVAFSTPPLVTLKGALAKVACPNWIPVSASAIRISVVAGLPREIDLPLASNVKLVAVKVLPSIVNPAICPLFAVTFPVICAADAVICPLAFNLKFWLADFISVELIWKLAIVPAVFAVIVLAVISPVIWAADAVICPLLPFSFNVEPAELDKSSPIVKPPISPLVAVILPLTFALEAVMLFIITSPSGFTWNLDELISMFPLLPLTNWLSFWPKKNLGVSMVTALPLRVVVPLFCITNVPPLPLIKFVALPNLKLGAPKLIELPLAVNLSVPISTLEPSNFINFVKPLPT